MFATIAGFAALVAFPSIADPVSGLANLRALPHADVARLVGNWEVAEMKPIRMIYEFQPDTMAMHGKNPDAGTGFELAMDADYRTAGKGAIWVIGTNPRTGPNDPSPEAGNSPSIMGIEFTDDDHATMTVSTREHFTLVRVR